MRLLIALLSLNFICLCQKVTAQNNSDVDDKTIQALLDSAEIYKLKDPEKNLVFTRLVLDQSPFKGSQSQYIRALLNGANSSKMLSKKEDALRYATQAVAKSKLTRDPLLLVRSYYMKASVFGQYENQDSTIIYYQKVIDLNQPDFDPYYISSAYTSIGRVYASIENLSKAEEYILKGYQVSRGDEYAKLFTLSTLIGFYAVRDNPKYLPYLDTLASSDFYKNASHESFMSHFESFLLLDEASDAEKEKKLREVFNYSLTHSSDVGQVGMGMKLYQHLDKMGKHEEAHRLLLQLHQITIESGNGEHITGVIHALYENSKARGDMKAALNYLEQNSQLRDSLLSDENRNQIAELNIKFETAQKDNEIERQKNRLEQEARNRNFLIVLTTLLSTLAIVVFIYFRNRARSAQRIAEQEKVIHLQETERLIKEKELSELTATLETQEKERNRIARDLHDGLGSMMSGISSQIEYLRSQPVVEKASHPHLAQLKDMVNDATAELRRTSYELMPAKLLRQGLEPAIRDLCLNLLVRNGIEPTLEINDDLNLLNAEQQLTLYRIVQELLNNIVKHAQSQHVLIQFTRIDDEISLVVEDDGKGFDVASRKMDGGLGLGSLGSRVNLLKGFLDIASTPGEGTTVTVNFLTA